MKLTAESTVINDSKLNSDISDARNIADSTAQYFWFKSTGTDTGAHISEKTQAEFIASPSGGNLLARSNGIAVRDGLQELAVFSLSTRIGLANSSRTEIAPNEITMYTDSGATAFHISGSGVTKTIGKTVTVNEPVLSGNSKSIVLPNFADPGALDPLGNYYYVTITNYPNAESTAYLSIPKNTNASNTRTGTVAFSYTYIASTRTLTITANQGMPVLIHKYLYPDQIELPLTEITGELHINDGNVADFVTNQGKSGMWTYRTWSSGIKECWGTYSDDIAITTSAAAYGGYRSSSISIPTLPITFTSTPTVTATANSTTGYWVNNVVPTTTGGSFYLSAGASLSTATRNITFHFIGA